MSTNQPPRRAGRHFLQIPGPSPVPDRILRAMAGAVLDHRGPEFQKLGLRVLAGIKTIFKTKNPVIIFPCSGTGAWEAALVNVLSPGDHVLMYETGHFAALWNKMATELGIKTEVLPSDWRAGVEPARIEARLREDTTHSIKAVCVVHNETATGSTSRIEEVRKAIDAANHPALLMVDTISGLGSADYRHDEWGVDVSISGSQKGLMLPPGIAFNAVSDKAIAVSKVNKAPKMFWSWEDQMLHNKNGFFPYTPATNMLYALAEAVDMMHEEGMDRVFARHERHAEATRLAVAGWGLENLCTEPKHYSPVLTAVLLPDGHNSDNLRKIILDNFDMSLGTGLSKVAGRVFRIGHLGDTNDLTILGTLAGVEMGLALAGVPHRAGGVQTAMAYLANTAPGHRHG
jgi:alanine-glyoxylate transaminase / serine-glyoxylate transaminase / serine-pyruvate transaminase